MESIGQRKLVFTAKVMEVFADIQRAPSIHKTQIFQLLKYSHEDPDLFMYAFEQSYLKIFHSFHSKANKKIPTKFENLAESFFEAALPKPQEALEGISDSNQSLAVFASFLFLCTEGIYSTIMNIRIMCARLAFLLIKLIPPRKMSLFIGEEVQSGIEDATLHLLRTKVSTYRQLGVKLASLIIHVSTTKSESIEREMFKILAVEDNEQIRKLVITNLTITPQNLEEVLVRLRDKNPEIRAIVAKKLQGERFRLEDMTVSNLYKLLYDGYGSKEILVKKECLRYFAMYFISEPNTMEDETYNKQLMFVRMFRPEILLLNPHLYHLFDELVLELLEEVEQTMRDYIRGSCEKLRRGNLGEEAIWLKNAVRCQAREISKIYEEYGPTGVDLSKVLLTLAQKQDVFAIFELLQLFGRQSMPDQIGRNKMFDALKELLSHLAYSQVNPDYSNFKPTDICHILSPDELTRKKLMLSYYDMPIISSSFDLIFQIGEAMKNLRADHYEIEMKQVMAEWHNPDENTVFKEKELLEKNIKSLQAKGDKSLLPNMRAKLQLLEDRLEQDSEKTRKVLMCISRLRYNCDLEMFLSIIKEELGKEEKANGLLLLGMYCLENEEKVSNFWGIFWGYIEKKELEEKDKNHLLVSLKVVIDFIVKFNCLGGGFSPENMEDFNADMFMDEMVRLMLHSDADIRVLAIESLCRLLYHERIDKSNETTYFLLLILLWLETSTEVVSAKSVHTVSIFIKSYMQKGNLYCQKLSEIFCEFFKVMLRFQEEKKVINKSLIKYNLKMEEFLKKTVFTVMTIFKYQKESRNVIWKYSPHDTEIGPQEFLLLFFLKEERITYLMGRALMLCDFYEFCSLETLILVKKIVEELNETRKWKGQGEQLMKKLEADIEMQISLKNSDVFNDQAVESMEKQYEEKMKFLEGDSRYVHKNIDEKRLFVRLDQEDSDDDSPALSSSESSQSLSEEEEQARDSHPARKKRPISIEIESENEQQQKQSWVSDKAKGPGKKPVEPAIKSADAPARSLRSRRA